MTDRFNTRIVILVALMVAAFLFLGIYYYALAAGVGEEETAEEKKGESLLRSVETTGMRGSVLDKNGIPLAYDTASYDVQFLMDPTKTAASDKAYYTDVFQKTVELIENNGGKMLDTFLIKRREDGEFAFDLDFLVKDESDSSGKAQRQKRIENWCKNMYIADTITEPEDMYNELRSRYRIPESASYEDAIKLLSIWQEVQLNTYRIYAPITIAEDVSYSTVIEIETRANELTGMSIAESSIRVYPKGTTAAHVVGYTGRITDLDDVDKLKDDGYDIDNDLIGKSGVEATMEQYLTGASNERKGERVLEVDENGSVLKEISSTSGSNGDNVVLTLDIKMQEVLEQALKSNIDAVRETQEERYLANKEKYDEAVENRTVPEVDMCDSGAAIVMDCNTGDILAMASYPTYDPNLFVGGISDADYAALTEGDASAFFNNAVSSKSTPGSIFKICTGIAGLMEGVINVDTVINDEGPYDKYIKSGHVPKCWVQPYYSRHASHQTIIEAIKVSCNYFFYKTADLLGIEKLNQWADNFGLLEKTGIELTGEAVGQVGNQQVRYDRTKSINEQLSYTPLLVYNRIVALLAEYGQEREVEYSEELIKETAEEILQLAGSVENKKDYGPEIRSILSKKLEIPVRVSTAKGWSLTINQYLNEIIWTPTDTVNQGIGVAPTLLTPIGIVRYISAVANGGQVLEPHIVDRVIDPTGEIVYQTDTTVIRDLGIDSSYLDAIYEGMREVVSPEDGGGAAKAFKNFAYTDKIVGKTGTGKVSDIDLENNGWFVCFAPFGEDEKPEIAIVVFLPNGISGTDATPTARDFLQYYFDSKTEVTEVAVVEDGSLAG